MRNGEYEGILDDVYDEGVFEAELGISRESNPYELPTIRAAWFQGYDDAVAAGRWMACRKPANRIELIGDVLGYITLLVVVLCLLALPN